MPSYRDKYVQLTDTASSRVSFVWDCWKDVVPTNRRISGWWTRTSKSGTQVATCVLDRITTANVENLYDVSANESRKFYPNALKSWPMGVRPAVLVRIVK